MSATPVMAAPSSPAASRIGCRLRGGSTTSASPSFTARYASAPFPMRSNWIRASRDEGVGRCLATSVDIHAAMPPVTDFAWNPRSLRNAAAPLLEMPCAHTTATGRFGSRPASRGSPMAANCDPATLKKRSLGKMSMYPVSRRWGARMSRSWMLSPDSAVLTRSSVLISGTLGIVMAVRPLGCGATVTRAG